MIPSGTIYLITMGNNSNITSGDFFLISPRDFYKIPEDTIAVTFYKSTPSAPTNYKIHLVDPYPTTSVETKTDYTSNPISHLKLSDSKIRQQTCSRIFNYRQDPKYLKRYNEKKTTGARPRRTGLPPFQRSNVIL